MQMRNRISKTIDQSKLSRMFKDEMFNDTVKYQKIYGFEIGKGEHATWNNEADAFKHAYMQAVLVLRYGESLGTYFANNHEIFGNTSMGQPKSEEDMDKNNNNKGVEIANKIKQKYGVFAMMNSHIKDEIAKEVIKYMQKGELILDPSGRKKPRKPLNIKSDASIQSSECAGSYTVSGYTRSDGTKVSEYTRTCGAEHKGKDYYSGKKFQDIPDNELYHAIGLFI